MTHSHAVLAKPRGLALGASVIMAGGDDTNRTGSSSAYNTPAVALTADRLYLLCIVTRRTDGNNGSLSAVQSGATWASAVDIGISQTRSTIFRCQPGSNVPAATIAVGNFDPVNVDFVMWSLIELTGTVDDSAGNGAGAISETGFNTGTGDSPSKDVGTVAAPNATVGFCYHDATSGFTPVTGLELADTALGGRALAAMWNPGGDTIGAQASGTGGWHCLAAEVLAA